MNALRSRVISRTLGIWLALLAAVILIAFFWGGKISQEISIQLLVHAEVPAQEVFDELVQSYPDPVPFLQRVWKSGKLVHRELVMEALSRRPVRGGTVEPHAEALFIAGAQD